MLENRRITLGVSGGIAAYKAAELASALVRDGAQVHVIMTAAAQQFIRPLTFQTLTGNPVHTDLFACPPGWHVPHIELARADLLVVAPATANILAKAACGLGDDLLSTTLLAATCPVLFCPAMNVHMYDHPRVQANLNCLRERGCSVCGPETGHLACGEQGRGRLADPAVIREYIVRLLTTPDMKGLKVLVTAGGTREPLDPVRYLSNRSSGKMGYALARAAVRRGAQVTLVTAARGREAPAGVRVVCVETAQEMHRTVMELFPQQDVVAKAAAVADYRPREAAAEKIKKHQALLVLELERTPDILAALGRQKQPHQTVVGFAAETGDLEANARQKAAQKNVDLLVANDVTMPGAGFDSDTNIVKLVYPGGAVVPLPCLDKLSVAHQIWDAVLQLRRAGRE
ncbi:bifunctional phosphopantothenoylcysteine decarboxylase/phosphopantothenate--cysteine ligase CoaBC [Desulfotomaculum copahuensis]|uniref:Coenzyme A biosynthesis bifunctional protein CoaBC n=1 Tax=Desulfotomaculum copahuensis TaxID=1838280 RepID=A0A1B7LED8_9FIRM|nr:bifunctional phosphopantothenoylcysteine decarboxylase/phosphopantothenate--cysteine ligase CoaBC [Desulfotomaculum copahuensis]OAT81424.1 phosphopantothenoylcysteine decarboxylase [Desulfotomaculum copahuensis]